MCRSRVHIGCCLVCNRCNASMAAVGHGKKRWTTGTRPFIRSLVLFCSVSFLLLPSLPNPVDSIPFAHPIPHHTPQPHKPGSPSFRPECVSVCHSLSFSLCPFFSLVRLSQERATFSTLSLDTHPPSSTTLFTTHTHTQPYHRPPSFSRRSTPTDSRRTVVAPTHTRTPSATMADQLQGSSSGVRAEPVFIR